MRKKILLLALGLVSGCSQPSVTIVATQSTAPTVKQSAVAPQIIASSSPQTQASAMVASNNQVIVQPDGTLLSKGSLQVGTVTDDVSIKPSTVPTQSPTVTSTPYTNSQTYVSNNPTNNSTVEGNSPLPETIPATPCDRSGQISTQCKDYLESIKPPKPPYSVNLPLPEGVKSGNVNIVFKDEYKVRKSKDPNAIGLKLTSISGQEELKQVEEILKSYEIDEVFGIDIDEKNANNFEASQEKECECDRPNMLSMYAVYTKDQDIKEIIERLRAHPIIRGANFGGSVSR